MKKIVISIFIMLSSLHLIGQEISSKFPFQSKYIEIFESKIHYIEEYEDSTNPNQLTFLFIHGNPTSSYLWRNIIPYVNGQGKAIAIDLIGMGKSDKPNIDYTLKDHIKYVEEFIRKKELKNLVLVLHDWGSAIGFHYASRYESNIKGIIFMEAMAKPELQWSDFNFIERMLFKRFRHPKKGHKMIAENNFFIKTFLPILATKRKLTKEEKAYYAEPYPTIESRKPIEVFPNEIPIEGEPPYPTKIINEYVSWLQKSKIPKLLLYAKPGMIIKKKDVETFKQKIENLEAIYIGKGKHYLQEDHPHEIGKAMKNWTLKTLITN